MGYVVAGVFLQAVGVYGPIAEWGGAGATVPPDRVWGEPGQGVEKAVSEQGWLGIFTGPFTAAAGGVAAAVLFGVIAALLFKPGEKR